MTPTSAAREPLVDLIAEGVLDAELAALCWLLVEGGVPVVVTGEADRAVRQRVVDALLRLPPAAALVTIDLDDVVPTVQDLAVALGQGDRVALLAAAPDLRALMDALTGPGVGLPEDAVRRLGLVLVVGTVPSVAPGPVVDRPCVLAAHYLRPLERDGGGHVQRRPPAVLATWGPADDAFDHFAWGVVGELADRVDRSEATFEELQAGRAAGLAALARREPGAAALEAIVAAEPARVPASPRSPAVPSPLHSPLTDPHVH